MTNLTFYKYLNIAQQHDNNDPLSGYRNLFHIPKSKKDEEVIYFCGNSLGLMPKSANDYIAEVMTDWKELGVEAHFATKHSWMPYHELVTEQLADVVGALPIEVVAMNSLTTNLHLAMTSFYQPNGKRKKIIIENGAFPSDRYAVVSQIEFHRLVADDCLIELKPRSGEYTLRTEDIVSTIEQNGEELALVMLGGVNYLTGQAFDIQSITKAAHSVGAFAGFDLAHAAGNLKLNLHDWDVDFACWCSYKYLNSSPGGIGGMFIHEKHANNKLPKHAGWWGHDKKTRFLMPKRYIPIEGVEGWQLSNPPILLLAVLRASLDIFTRAGMTNLRAKSESLTSFLEQLLLESGISELTVVTPSEKSARGAQLSLRVKNVGKDLHNKFTERGIIADWREPDIIRVAPTPLYNTFEDVYNFVSALREITKEL